MNFKNTVCHFIEAADRAFYVLSLLMGFLIIRLVIAFILNGISG